MEKVKAPKKDNSILGIALILIIVGGLWMLRELGLDLHLAKLFMPFKWMYSHLGRVLFSWPMVLLIIGLVLVSGKHSGGWILVALGGFFLLPRIFIIPGFSFALIFPLTVLITGVFLILRR